MRYMIIVRATKDSEAGVMPSEPLIAGYTLIQAKSREETIARSRRFPNPAVDGGVAQIEVRQPFNLDEFEPSEAVERFRAMGIGGAEGKP